ncbi:MAG: alpha-galactosidase [Clostridia bacterium]|nr:alpha-galactosidase [Clostridia bacterium]
MKFEIQNESLCLVNGGNVLVSGITGYLKHAGDFDDIITVPAEGAWTTDGDTASCDNMTMEMTACGDGVLLRGTFRNVGPAITVPCSFTSFAGTLHRTIDRAVINRPFEFNGNRVCEMESVIDTVHTVYGDRYDSADNTVFDTIEGDAYIFGAATYDKYFSCVTVSREGYITAYCNTEWHTVKTGDAVTSEWFLLAPCDDCVSGLDKFARTVASLAGVERSTRENPVGYCSWYYYGQGVTADSVRQNMDVLAAHKELLPVKYVQIDDGWYDCWGSWKVNGKFGDMKAYADEIKARGFIPGIWIAPFGCREESGFVQNHPDWLVKDKDGEIWRAPYALCMDFTNPEVREYLAGIFRTLSYEWGYRYIKMDIITPTIAPGVHFDPDATALENYRLGLEVFKNNVTEDTFLLGCTAPFGGAIGYVDGMRVSCDIFERWDSVRDIFNATLKRYYYHRNYYLIDGDCLIIRKKENEDEECMRPCTRTDEEIRTYVTAMAASGGILMLSDKLPLLSEEQLTLISKLYPINQECALPLDLMDSFIPGVLDFGKKGTTRTVALINWGDAPRTMSVENDSALVWEFWDKTFAIHNGGAFSVTVPAHGSSVFFFTDLADAAVIGSDASIVMQSPWTKEDGRIVGQTIKGDETVYVASRTALTATDGEIAAVTETDGYTVYRVTSANGDYTLSLH